MHNRIADAFLGSIRQRVIRVHEQDHLQNAHEQDEDENDHQDKLHHRLAGLPCSIVLSTFNFCDHFFQGPIERMVAVLTNVQVLPAHPGID